MQLPKIIAPCRVQLRRCRFAMKKGVCTYCILYVYAVGMGNYLSAEEGLQVHCKFERTLLLLPRFSQRTRKMTLEHFLKRQNRSKNKIRKITVKSQNDVKNACFWHVLCYISAIFKDINLKFCTHIHETLPSNIWYDFLKILIWGKLSWKEKKWTFLWKLSDIFKILKIRDSSFCSPTNFTSFHISQLIVALKLL